MKMRRMHIFKPVHAGTAAFFALLLITGCLNQATNPKTEETASGSITMSGTEELDGATVKVSSDQYADSVIVSSTDSTVKFSNLEAGTYEVEIRMPDGPVFSSEVAVVNELTSDLGEIIRVDFEGEGGTTIPVERPDSVSENILWHYPADGDTVYALSGVYYGDDETVVTDSAVAGSASVTVYPVEYIMTEIGTDSVSYLSVTVQFSKPMDRQSVEEAFRIVPSVSGEFGWNYYFICSDPSTDYTLRFDTPEETDGASSGSAEEPLIYPMPVEADTSIGTSFSYTFPAEDSTAYTVSFSGILKDSSGAEISEDYTFSFFVVHAEIITPNPIPVPPPHPMPGDTIYTDCACTAMFASSTVLVVDEDGSPVSGLDVEVTNKRTNEVIENLSGSWGGAGTYTVLDDSYTGNLTTEPDTILFTGTLSGDTCSGVFLFNTDECNCHINKVSGPDTLYMELLLYTQDTTALSRTPQSIK